MASNNHNVINASGNNMDNFDANKIDDKENIGNQKPPVMHDSNNNNNNNSIRLQAHSSSSSSPMAPAPPSNQQQQARVQQQSQPQPQKRPTSCVSILSGASGLSLAGSGTGGGQPATTGQKQHKLKSRFTVLKKLGKGTYGKVQLAINKETGQEVAIKTIKKTKIENEQDLQRVRREIQIMSSIEHPHIIHIYEVFENKDKIVLIMQYAPGGELYEYVSQSRVLDDSEARRLFRQIATAIYYCHQNKICHRDLKLENILLDEKNNAKLADFGLSNVFSGKRQLKTFCGSPLYASPEIVQGSPYEGPEVDCWSLGVLLYTLVYGAMPFDGSNFKRLVKQISEACYYEPKQKSQASPLIGRLLCADPLKRANILDICSDPWVNGATASIPPSPKAVSPTKLTPSHHGHPSLLKVAQDMANLTPVRIDILLALNDPPPQQQLQQEQQKLPLAPPRPISSSTVENIQQQQQPKRTAPNEAAKPPKPARRPPPMAPTLDPTMEVDESRSTSPVASYIVRDLDGDNQAETNQGQQLNRTTTDEVATVTIEPQVAMVDEKSTLEQQDIHQEQDNRDVEMSVDQKTSTPSSKGAVPKLEQQQQQQVGTDDIQMDTQLDRQAEDETVQSLETGIVEQENMAVIEETKSHTESKNDITMDVGNDNAPDISGEKRVEEMAGAMDIAEELEAVACDQAPSSIVAAPEQPGEDVKPEEQQQEQQQQQQQESEDIEKPPNEAEPKKVKKKKIVIVKKRKKVTKPSEEPATDDKNDNDHSASNKLEDHQSGRQQAKGPGKVKIPDTFQAATATPSSDTNEASQKAPATGRKQSALIADVSQKLLQQHQQHLSGSIQNSAATIEVDQPQLASVKVSDKKSEFERRASLNATSVNSGGPQGANKATQQQASATATTTVATTHVVGQSDDDGGKLDNKDRHVEPKRADSRREILNLVDLIEQTSAGPVDGRQQAMEVSLKPPRVVKTPSESVTPTGGDQPKASDISDRLAECVGRLDPEDPDRFHGHLLETSARDDRSDSVDTIRAELAPDAPPIEAQQQQQQVHCSDSLESKRPNVRTSLHIDLGAVAKQRDDYQDQERSTMPSGQQQQVPSSSTGLGAIGPAPITRSYKKVTFTKDGTCITETGKIYSTQGDDGTVRRIERKSKVTHFPGDFNGDSSKKATEETTEEIIYEGGTNSARLWPGDGRQSTRSSASAAMQHRPFERLIRPAAELFADSSSEADFGYADPFPSLPSSSSSSNQHQRGLSSERSRQSFRDRGRADSASSCSSGSTDAFDDTFDTWTGAIDMFGHHNRHLSELHNSLIRRAFGGSPIPFSESIHSSASRRNSTNRRPQSGPFRAPEASRGDSDGRRSADVVFRSTRCGSVEPQMGAGCGPSGGAARHQQQQQQPQSHHHQHHHHHQGSTGSRRHGGRRSRLGGSEQGSGYESDDLFERPGSANLLGARGRLFGSRDLFPRTDGDLMGGGGDPFARGIGRQFDGDHPLDPFGASLFRDLEMEHERLRRKLASKQLWKGSTPSLFGHSSPLEQQFGHQEQHSRVRSSEQQTREIRGQQLPTMRQSVPLSPTPTRRNTANLEEHLPPRQPMAARRSTSRTSLITSQMSDMRIGSARSGNSSTRQSISEADSNTRQQQQQQQHHVTASFIELKRTPSNQQQQQHQLQQQHRKVVEDIGATIVDGGNPQYTNTVNSSREGSSSVLWHDSCITPSVSASLGSSRSGQQQQQQPNQYENPNLRVQTWLQQSIGDLSISSGSKSSASDTFASSSTRSDQAGGGHVIHQIPIQREDVPRLHQLPPPSSRSPSKQLQQQQHFASAKTSVSRAVRSTSKQSIANNDQVVQQQQQQQQKQQVISSNEILETSSNGRVHHHQEQSSSSLAKVISQTNTMLDDWPISRNESILQSSQSILSSRRRQQQLSSPNPLTAVPPTHAELGLNWVQSNTILDGSTATNPSSSRLFGDDLDDVSLSGSAADLESRSSSSLLDQLRSRGYRSMINQRMAIQEPAIKEVVVQTQETSQIMTTAATTTTTTTRSAASPTGAGGQTRYVTNASIVMTSAKADQDGATKVLQSTTSSIEESKTLAKPKELDQSKPTESTPLKTDDPIDGRANNDHNNYNKNTAATMQQVSATGAGETDDEPSSENKNGLIANTNGNSSVQHEANTNTNDKKTNGVEDNNNNNSSNNNDDDDEMDEDVREAKANIKEYLDRMRETEQFLKTMHEEEENLERQRQQLYLFNNLMLNTKLNGFRSKGQSTETDEFATVPNLHRGPQSAPIRMGNSSSVAQPLASEHSNGFMVGSNLEDTYHPAAPSSLSSSSLSYQAAPQVSHSMGKTTSYIGGGGVGGRQSMGFLHGYSTGREPYTSFSNLSSDLYPTTTANWLSQTVDPLQPVQPITRHSFGRAGLHGCTDSYSMASRPAATTTTNWRRSKSQLGDYFSGGGTPGGSTTIGYGSRFSRTSARPATSATIDTDLADDLNPYFPSSRLQSHKRRSVSQMRSVPTTRSSNIILGDTNNDGDYQPMMSEYRSAYGPRRPSATTNGGGELSPPPPPTQPASTRARASRPLSFSGATSYAELGAKNVADDDDDDDDGMSAYRARSYVPKVVPSGGPQSGSLQRGRDMRRRGSSVFKASSPERDLSIGRRRDRLSSISPVSSPSRQPERRTSLQLSNNTSGSKYSSLNWDASPPTRRRSLATSIGSRGVGPICGVGGGVDDRSVGISGTGSSGRRTISSSSQQLSSLENSRLSELEQRIQANKRRREELLSGKSLTISPSRQAPSTSMESNRAKNSLGTQSDDDDNDGAVDQMDSGGFERPSKAPARGTSQSRDEPLTTGGSGVGTHSRGIRSRPSRLESMEARIKRRSYCVRMGSPERRPLERKSSDTRQRARVDETPQQSRRYSSLESKD